MNKTCRGCHKSYPETAEYFYRNGGGFKHKCKSCCNSIAKNGNHYDEPDPVLDEKMVPAAIALHTHYKMSYLKVAEDLGVSVVAVSAFFRGASL